MKLEVDGNTVFAATGGRPFDAGVPTVVFIHGAGQDHTLWVLPSRYFARHGRSVLAVDLPGHGRSGGEPLANVEAMADWIVQVLDAAGVEAAALVGHSLGSLVALDIAGRFPDRARALAMVGTAFPMPVGPPLLKSAEANGSSAIDMLNFWGFSRSAHLGGSATPGMWMLGGGRRLFERAAPGVIHQDLAACDAYEAGMERAAEVRCPTLFVLGERDVMTPTRNVVKLAEAIPESRTVVLEGAGHALIVEQPDAVLDALITVV